MVDNNPEAAPSVTAPDVALPAQEAPDSGSDNGGWLSEELTPGELAYFNSRGNDLSGLDIKPEPAFVPAPQSTPAPPPPPPAPAPISAEPAPTPPPAPPVPESVGADEDVDLDSLHVDQHGVMRDDRGRFVPHSALHKAREKYKAARTAQETANNENAQLRQQLATLEGRFASLSDIIPKITTPEPAAPPAPPVDEDPAPDPETNIFGYVAWQSRQMDKLRQQLEATVSEVKKDVSETRGEMTEQAMLSHYKSDAASFHSQKPEFAQAYRHLIDSRHAELALLGWGDPQQRQAQIATEEKAFVRAALSQNKRPAEFIYNVAVSRGFRAPAAPTPTPPPPPPPPAPPVTAAPPAPTTPANATPASISAAQQLINAATAQRATATLSGAGGASGETITMDAVASMSDAEFEALQNRIGRRGMKQFLGG